MSRSEVFTLEQVMNLTDNGRDIFERELGFIPSKNISSPLRTGDDNPSFQVKQTKFGNWIAIDHNGSFRGNAISFVMEMYRLSLPEAIEKVVSDLGLRERKRVYAPKIKKEISSSLKSGRLIYDVETMPFTKRHIDYFECGGLKEDFLNSRDVNAVRKWAINGVEQHIKKDEFVFSYYAPDIDKFKILRLGENVPSEKKWRSQMDNTYLWSWYKYKGRQVDDLFVVKSRKDELILDLLGYDTISVQNESAAIFLANNKDKVLSICKNPIINFGTDEQGKEQSILITKELGCRWFNIQNHLYNQFGIEDNFSFSCEFGLKILDQLIQLKGFKKREI